MKPLLPLLASAALIACAPPAPERPPSASAPTGGFVPAPLVHSIPAQPSGDPEARQIAQAALASVAPGRMPAPAGPGEAGAQGGVGAPLQAPMQSGPLTGMAENGALAPGPATDGAAGTGTALTRDEVLDMDTARATRDAEREAFERRRATFEEVAPTALPERPDEAPNIVAYALRTSNRVGEQVHRRSALSLQNTSRNCAQFSSPNDAQEEFLRRGGPERDPLNLDPDGDGFACGWDPEPFRAAARAGD